MASLDGGIEIVNKAKELVVRDHPPFVPGNPGINPNGLTVWPNQFI